MKLTDLDAEFVKLTPTGHTRVNTLSEAQGICFMCPLCQGHYILAWFKDKGIPDSMTPGPGRWTPSGTGISDLTLTPSIDLSKGTGDCMWHGHVTRGEAR